MIVAKPVAELGLAEDEQRIISDIDNRLRELGISELVTACPNCYDFLGGKLEAKVVSIYDKLAELGIGAEVEGGKKMFMPCPDRECFYLRLKRILQRSLLRRLMECSAVDWEEVQEPVNLSLQRI